MSYRTCVERQEQKLKIAALNLPPPLASAGVGKYVVSGLAEIDKLSLTAPPPEVYSRLKLRAVLC